MKSPGFSAGDRRFMALALVLAERGRGKTNPNPVVGAVLVRGGRIVSEGFHHRAGGPHAEVNALAALPGSARGTTLYVTLEPCCHTGRTGPCTDAILAAGPARVVVGCRDPNPIVDGRGIARLRRAGLRVDVGCLEAEARAAIAAYAIWVRDHRPLVTLKAAATLDGFIAGFSADRMPRGRRAPVWITGEEARRAAHTLRAAHDAILVGAGTVRADDPHLTVRLDGSRPSAPKLTPPLRVVLAGRRGLPKGAHVLDDAAPTLTIQDPSGRVLLKPALEALAARGIQSLLVEGGAAIHGAFIAAGLVDRVALFVAPKLLGGGVPVAAGANLPVARALPLGPISVHSLGADLLLTAEVDRR